MEYTNTSNKSKNKIRVLSYLYFKHLNSVNIKHNCAVLYAPKTTTYLNNRFQQEKLSNMLQIKQA